MAKKAAKKKSSKTKDSKAAKANGGANLGFEQTLWAAADKLRNNMDAAEYKHVVLGLIFLKYISDAFAELHEKLLAQQGEGADPEDPDEYRAENCFWVPSAARWAALQDAAKDPNIGKLVDDAMDAIETDNPRLKGVLPKNYARPALDKQRLGELIDLVGTIGLGDKENRSLDILGRVYEYFLSQFASAEGKKGGQFYTPRSVVGVLVEMLSPYKGRVFDPCCGSGGMFVQSEKFVEAHGGRIGDISIYGQESNPTTWRLAQMNLAIRGIEAHLGPHHADTFKSDQHKDLKADYVLANPPFNDSDWGGDALAEDVRWQYGTPPKGNANFAWVQHFVHHLAPTGTAGFVLANGSMSSNQSGEGTIRQNLVEADLVDCMVALPGQLFYSTQIPVCLWFLIRSKKASRKRQSSTTERPERDRQGETLFIDARKLGTLVDRVHRELSDDDIATIADTYHAWKSKPGTFRTPNSELRNYEDIPGFCKSATLEEIKSHGYVLTPGRYVGAAEVEEDDEPFAEKMQRLTSELSGQFAESAKLEAAIKSNLEGLGAIESHAVLKKCIAANRALAELKGAGNLIPNQAILINAIPLQEAKLSSEIENIVTTQDELFRATIDEASADRKTKEVLRYRTALNHGANGVHAEGLTVDLLVDVCGTIRDTDVSIRDQEPIVIGNRQTGEVIYTPPRGRELLRRLLANLVAFLDDKSSDGLDDLVKMSIAHYQFEAIHPFDDGNGRTGRILNALYLIDRHLLSIPVLYLSRYIIEHKPDYYRLLRGVTEDQAWEPWLLFMLDGIAETSEWTTRQIQRIRKLFDETCDRCRDELPGRVYSKELIELIFVQPYCKIGFVVDAGIAKRKTASDYLQQLEGIGVLESEKIGREVVYRHPALLEVLTA
ncbi:Putative type I restriction enzyme HindVIIP M protein (M.HindVIIP) [Durusdinium trenchii]|uniref:site-specific DNA-methyltransferase (adenine-specific) n=1 Tax=Durusdinium trenchii TaxID=1381693 RepID=A0ABP0LE78_9DINO